MNTLSKRILFFFAGLLAFVISLLLCLPVILLPPATAVPAWAWIPLAAADLAPVSYTHLTLPTSDLV